MTNHHLPHRDLAEDVLRQAKGITAEHGEMGNPAIFVYEQGGYHFVHPQGSFNSSMYKEIWKKVNELVPNATHVIVAQDCLSRTFSKEEMPNLADGSKMVAPSVLRERGDTKVTDSIMIMVFDHVYGFWATSTPYHKDNNGVVVFEETSIMDAELISSRIPSPFEGRSFVPKNATVN